MNFSLNVDGSMMTGNISPEAMMGMSSAFGAAMGGLTIARMTICFTIGVFMIISRWRIFKKAGIPGWGVLIPVYNIVLMLKLGGMSGRRALALLFPPLLGIIMIINIFKIVEKFGKHWTFGLGMLLVKIVFVPILAFDNSKYLGKKVMTKAAAKPVAKVVAKAPAKKVIVKKAPAKKVVKKTTKKAPAKKVKLLKK